MATCTKQTAARVPRGRTFPARVDGPGPSGGGGSGIAWRRTGAGLDFLSKLWSFEASGQTPGEIGAGNKSSGGGSGGGIYGNSITATSYLDVEHGRGTVARTGEKEQEIPEENIQVYECSAPEVVANRHGFCAVVINQSDEIVYFKPEETTVWKGFQFYNDEAYALHPGMMTVVPVDGVNYKGKVKKITDFYSSVIIEKGGEISVSFDPMIIGGLGYIIRGGELDASPDDSWDRLFSPE